MSEHVRAAADLLKSAIDRHLEACERRSGEEDPAVQRAYDAVREAAESYDDALFDAYEEVTPFEFSTGPQFETIEVSDERTPARVSVLVRRDFAVTSPDDLMAVGQALSEDEDDDGKLTPVEALAALLEEQGLDVTVETEDAGLHYLGGTMWVVSQPVEDDSLTAAPFVTADESHLLIRLDEEVVG